MYDANPEKISKGIIEILDNPQKKEHILKGCKETKKLLGETHCVVEVAKEIKNELVGE